MKTGMQVLVMDPANRWAGQQGKLIGVDADTVLVLFERLYWANGGTEKRVAGVETFSRMQVEELGADTRRTYVEASQRHTDYMMGLEGPAEYYDGEDYDGF